MQAAQRQLSLRKLASAAQEDVLRCRDIEAACHAMARSEDQYHDNVQRALVNLRNKPSAGAEVVTHSDEDLLQGTPLGRMANARAARDLRFSQMLQEKYDALNDKEYQSIVHCNRCGSKEVMWEEKQTRSADEGATLFCMCTKCKNRWVIR